MSLDQIATQIKTCTKCPLHENRTKSVPGEGNSQAEIIFIGEGPGQAEDLQGRPFVGEAGKFLDELLRLASLKREEVFITNMVKCRPPTNRDPLPEEVTACWPYLEGQLKVIKPKLIITLGRHALEKFIPDRKISLVHGQLKKLVDKNKKTIYIYPLYHPAAALYHGSLKTVLRQDFERMAGVMKKVN